MTYRPAVAKNILLLMLVVVGGCSSSQFKPENYQAFSLAGCSAPVEVSFPKVFTRAPPQHAVADKRACRHASTPTDSYECLYANWAPDVSFPRMEVKVWPTIRYDPAAEPLMGGASRARDDRIIAAIRRFEPTAPSDDRALKSQYAQFFYDSRYTAPHLASNMSRTGSYLSGGRFYYVHGCVVSVEYFVSFPSEIPMTELNGYVEQTDVK